MSYILNELAFKEILHPKRSCIQKDLASVYQVQSIHCVLLSSLSGLPSVLPSSLHPLPSNVISKLVPSAISLEGPSLLTAPREKNLEKAIFEGTGLLWWSGLKYLKRIFRNGPKYVLDGLGGFYQEQKIKY